MRRTLQRFTGLLLLTSLLVLFAACSRQAGEPKLFDPQLSLDRSSIATLFRSGALRTGKLNYALVNPAWLEWHYPRYRAALSEGPYGVIRWDQAYTCTAFTTRFVSDAQLAYFAQAFHVYNPPRALGVGEFWYMPDDSKDGIGHAIVVALTVAGPRFYEPQTGQWVELSEKEIQSGIPKFD